MADRAITEIEVPVRNEAAEAAEAAAEESGGNEGSRGAVNTYAPGAIGWDGGRRGVNG